MSGSEVRHAPLLRGLADPHSAAGFSPAQWDRVIRQARAHNLLALLAARLQAAGVTDSLPPGPRAHLVSARRFVEHQAEALSWELDRILLALAPLGQPVVLLKGAAYQSAGLATAGGRLFTDIDLLVPKAALERVEKALQLHGWAGTHHDAYDQKYYRQWMHEIPPLRHLERGSVIDLHHSILPATSGRRLDAARLLERAVPLAAQGMLRVLAPEDLLLHSATHLFHDDGEYSNGLRDLFDLDAMLRAHRDDVEFWRRLPLRARELDLERPLYYALRYCQALLDSPLPDRPQALSGGAPGPLLRGWMDALLRRALAPAVPGRAGAALRAARFALYVRSHYLRMPLYLLIPHLARKSLRRARGVTA